MGPCPKNADAVLANANKLTAAVVDDLAHERMAGLFLTSWATEPFRRIILTNAGVIVVCRIPGRADTAGFTIFPTFVVLVTKKTYVECTKSYVGTLPPRPPPANHKPQTRELLQLMWKLRRIDSTWRGAETWGFRESPVMM